MANSTAAPMNLQIDPIALGYFGRHTTNAAVARTRSGDSRSLRSTDDRRSSASDPFVVRGRYGQPRFMKTPNWVLDVATAAADRRTEPGFSINEVKKTNMSEKQSGAKKRLGNRKLRRRCRHRPHDRFLSSMVAATPAGHKDVGLQSVCCAGEQEFLESVARAGNDLITPMPMLPIPRS